ncbi:Mediator of RNA polymerase II transcription subunit 15 [Brachionus plicatilis]|uniref:Mediator of RNA polymerase II transcription subunit 15 n=1 Tax=Brachionus plicatilis TaxID=10195 RepID=A0A3M7PD50_BRAPC|nr:Mediator of RNA polymerase II transcription subunit 15 [Brachionus plicatilis]
MEDIRECFTLNAWCGSWHLFGAAHALKVEINQIHPTIQKGLKNFVNRKLTPYSSEIQGTIHISWTHTVDKNVNKNSWTPNHFYCLLSTTKNSIKKKTQELLDESFSSIESGTDNKKEIIILSEIMITRCTRKSFHLDNEIDFQESVNEELIHTSSSLIYSRKEEFNETLDFKYFQTRSLQSVCCLLLTILIKKTIRLTFSNDSKNFDKILFAYVWDKGTSAHDKFLVPKPHGNCTKSQMKYVRIERSSLDEIKNVSLKNGSASSNFNRLINNKSTGSLSNVVRSRNQLYTHKYLQNKSKNIKTHDEFADALKNREKSDFVKYMNFGVDRLECILFSEQQYNDQIRFCISERNFSINTNNSHPVFIGPIMIHLNQDKQAYLTFAIDCFITDDDQATRSAFKSVFNQSNFMLCCNHLRKNFIKALNEHKVFEEDQEKLIIEVFGKKQERQNSLLGSKDNNEFYSRSDSLITKLKEFKHPYRNTDLSDWFQNNMVVKIFENFCEIIWSNEHIGKNYYTTNEIEVRKGINHKIKEFTADAQIDQSILAMRGSGEYIVSKYFRHYEYSIGRWSQLTSEEQNKKIDSFLKTMTERTITASYRKN